LRKNKGITAATSGHHDPRLLYCGCVPRVLI
jgi:hypothetical protein